MTLPFPDTFHVGLAVNDEASLISHTPGGKQAPVQREEIIVIVLPALGKETVLNGIIVATAANLCCCISRPIPTLDLADNALLHLLSSYIYCTRHRT